MSREEQLRTRGVTLITGASSGIGAELAECFAEHGFDLVLVARGEEALSRLAERLGRRHGVNVHVRAMDLTHGGAAEMLLDWVREQGLQVSVLVNNAGAMHVGRFDEVSLADHRSVILLNVMALTELTHVFARQMTERKFGSIMNVASISSFIPVPTMSVYAATKAFVLSFTESMSIELEPHGVTLTSLCPGFTRTSMLERAKASENVRQIPDFMVSDARAVAQSGFAACMEGRVVCVPGAPNSLTARIADLFPRDAVRGFLGLVDRYWS